MIAPGSHSARTKIQDRVGAPLSGHGANLDLVGGRRLHGYSGRSENWSSHRVKQGITEARAGAAWKPGQDTAEFRLNLKKSADLLGRSPSDIGRYGRWSSTHHLGTSTYKESPRLSTRIVPNETGSGCSVGFSHRPQKGPQKEILNGFTSTPSIDMSFKGGLSSPRQSSPDVQQNSRSGLTPNGATKRPPSSDMDISRSSLAFEDSEVTPHDLDRSAVADGNLQVQGLPAPQSFSVAPARTANQDAGKIQSPRGVTSGAGGYPANGVAHYASPRSVVPRIVGMSGVSKTFNKDLPSGARSQATNPEMASGVSQPNSLVSFPLQRLLERGPILHKGRLTHAPGGPRYGMEARTRNHQYFCEEPQEKFLARDGQD